jgi:hypothetical protein
MSLLVSSPRPLKMRVYKTHVAKTLNWYQEELTKKFGSLILSEAYKEIIRRDFETFHKMIMNREKTNSWQIPLKVDFKEDGTYQVNIVDENRLLYLDMPSH